MKKPDERFICPRAPRAPRPPEEARGRHCTENKPDQKVLDIKKKRKKKFTHMKKNLIYQENFGKATHHTAPGDLPKTKPQEVGNQENLVVQVQHTHTHTHTHTGTHNEPDSEVRIQFPSARHG